MQKRSIILDEQEIQAVFNGKKTQLRAPVKLPKWIETTRNTFGLEVPHCYIDNRSSCFELVEWSSDNAKTYPITCHLGNLDDLLYVQEGYKLWIPNDSSQWSCEYAARINGKTEIRHNLGEWDNNALFHSLNLTPEDCCCTIDTAPWNPAYTMPLAISRLVLQIGKVDVQRLQDINPLDAIAEGHRDTRPNDPFWDNVALSEFRTKWDSKYNPPLAWEYNPWIWVIKFLINIERTN